MTAEQLAQFFHETYERLAPQFGYKTREESAKPWANVPEQNRKLMTAVCAEVLTQAAAQLAEKEREIAFLLPQRNKWAMLCQHFGVPEKETCVATITDKFVAAEERLQEAQAEIELLKCLGRSTSPCGHFSRYAYTENGGKNIVCLWCELRQREAELGQEREAHEQIAKCLLPLVGTADGSSVSCAQRAAVEIKNLRSERSTS